MSTHTADKMFQIRSLLRGMSKEDLKNVNRVLKAEWREIDRKEAINVVNKFSVYDRVEFDSRKRGEVIYGVITGFGPKNVMLTSDDGVRWKVHPSLIRVSTKLLLNNGNGKKPVITKIGIGESLDTCPQCKKQTLTSKSKRIGLEAVKIMFNCKSCGYTDVDVAD